MKVDLAQLEKYSEGKMSAEERVEFEKALQQEASLSDELKKYLLSKSAIAHASNERLKKHLDELGRTIEDGYSQKTTLRPYLLAAAGIALLLGLGWAMIRYFQPRMTHDEIFLSFYQRPENYEMADRSSGSDTALIIWNTAMSYYSNHEIQKAVREFEYLTKLPDVTFLSRVYFFLGIGYLESNNFKKAIQAFDKVSTGSSYAFETQFYKALCFIKLNKQKEAVDMLRGIQNNMNHPYRKEALKILKMLN